MKKWFAMVWVSLVTGMTAFGASSEVTVSDLVLRGEIEGENIVFELSLDVSAAGKDCSLPLVVGDVAYLDGKLPKGAEIVRSGDRYLLKMGRSGWGRSSKKSVRFKFASRAVEKGEWRNTSFSIPAASIRRISVVCDRDDLEVRFPGALNIERQKLADSKSEVTAYLGITDRFQVQWKPEVKKLDSELVVSCEANAIATASVGAMRLDTIFTYRVIQGALKELELDLPDVSVTQVTGDDIQGWRIDRTDADHPRLIVSLSRAKEDLYRLRVESEMALPKFPSSSTLPVLAPRHVIRNSGFLQIGTDSAIKLQVAKAAGLTQVDLAAFPTVTLSGDASSRPTPARSLYAYQYAGTPYTLDITADDIVTTFTVDSQLVLTLADNELSLDASVEIDVKDAPAREIRIETDADAEWTVTSITGQHVSEADADVRDEDGKRIIYVPFRQAVHGAALVTIRMERSLKRDSVMFAAPKFTVLGAKSERGYLVMAAEKGIRLKAKASTALQEVHTGSAPMRIAGAQQAFRFKTGEWSLGMTIERTLASIDTEVFHLVSLGEGVMYCSAAITYHISGAPVQEFRVRVPESIETVEFTGADIEGWQREGEICMVRLQAKVMGDYTLLVTYDKQFDYEGAVIEAGGIETLDTDSEVGYIATASSASLELTESETLPGAIIRIDRDEIPSAYASPVNDPIIKSYKYVKNPHTVSMRIDPFDTEPLLGQIADYVKLETLLSKKGGAVTTGTYYIKNASRQYLVVNVPKGVDLWTIKVVDENGKKTDVLSQEKDDAVLIPVNRPQNPNTAIAIELVYAQSLGALGFWRSGVLGVRLDAPTLSDTHATFASWQVTVPDEMSIATTGGNMTPEASVRRPGISGALKKVWRLGRAMRSRRYTIRRALSGGCGGGRSQEFIRSVNLADERPLSIRLSVVPTAMGAASSARLMLGGVILGLALLCGSVVTRRPRLVIALGITAVVLGAAQCAAGRSVVAVCVWILIAFLFARYGIGFAWKLVALAGSGLMRVLRQVWRLIRFVATASYAVLGAGWVAWREHRARVYQRKLELTRASQSAYDIAPFESTPPPKPPPSPESPESGFALMQWLAVVAAVSMLALSGVMASASEQVTKQQEPPVPAPSVPVMDLITINMIGPTSDRDAEQSAAVNMTLEFETEGSTSFVVVPSACVLMEYDLNSRHAAIESSDKGYVLNVKKSGEYRIVLNFRTPVTEQEGRWIASVPLLENMRNRLTLELPENGMDIRADLAVLFRSDEDASKTTAEAVFGPANAATLSWRPRVRKTMLEAVVFFSEVKTLASLLSGVVDLTHVVRYQIAQGEMKELKILMPAGMSVTSVKAPLLATWSFDPETRLLEAVLRQAVTGDFTLNLQTQMPSEGLPYDAVLGALDIQGSARQRGAMAISAPDAVQIRVEGSETTSPMNIEDFSSKAIRAAWGGCKRRPLAIRRAFRYNEPGSVAIAIHAERVFPEIRVRELGSLSVADERIVLSTKIALAIAKSGIFSVRLGIPADFDVETLSGKDVSHWDEIAPGDVGTEDIGGGRGVTVHFNRHVNDATEINLVVARMEKGIESQISVPRVYVAEARKHAGRLTVAGERGVRMMVESHRGVDIKKASEAGITQSGVLVFDILRPTWAIVLKTEIMEPVIKPEVLQWVDLTEGMLKCQAFVNYEIENAGVKTFRLQSPLPHVALAVTGNNIARVHEIDPEQGVWQVELHGKVENQFAMTVGFQVPFNHEERRVSVRPLKTVDTEGQRGYVVVTCGGRVQVVPDEGLEGLKGEDPRSIPSSFGAGDLSDAILCYRTVRSDYELPLSVVRHESASVLPASISQVRMTSVVSGNRKLLTRLAIQLAVGDLRFLRMSLPDPKDALWTVLVNGREVSTSRDGERYCIPLEEQEGSEVSSVEVVYAGSIGGGGLLREHKVVAPSFEGLPLNDIEWSFFVLPQAQYYGFGGTMDLKPDEAIAKVFDTDSYMDYNRKQREATWKKARDVLSAGEQMAKVGRQKEARNAFQQALSYSAGKKDLSEDARVQLRNLTKQQFKMGLVNRRGAVRFRNNIIDEQEIQQMEGFQGGNFTQEYAASVEQQLSSSDNDALDVVAEKMLDQQAAAAGVVKAIRIVMPEHGRELRFARALQVDPAGELSVSFKVSRGTPLRGLGDLWSALFVFLAAFGLTALVARPKTA
ncbi:MAG: hypothetical protein HN341_18290 [Verrucomicrobia bacterium]|nr:hypothetical protein [Verrucomicrobiota bacterium]